MGVRQNSLLFVSVVGFRVLSSNAPVSAGTREDALEESGCSMSAFGLGAAGITAETQSM